MYRSTFLAPSHYAGKWIIPEEDQHYDLKAVNLLGRTYAATPDSADKEAKLLEVLECFHGYLMKYLCMIIRGTIPLANSRAGRDAKELLRTLAPRGAQPTKELTDATCKTLHLAFKQQTTEDIYDTVVFCFVKAARQYDPYYADKTRKVCEELYALPKQFTVQQLETRVGFDCTGILRALVRKGYVAQSLERRKSWDTSMVRSGRRRRHSLRAVLSDLSMSFRCGLGYYFKNHISEQLSELESNEGVLQLADAPRNSGNLSYEGPEYWRDSGDSEGNCVNSNGTFRFMADRTLMDMPLDVSSLNLDWIASTTDKLFKNLTASQRTILYLYFHEEQSFKTMANLSM
jgi:hypothetical protein